MRDSGRGYKTAVSRAKERIIEDGWRRELRQTPIETVEHAPIGVDSPEDLLALPGTACVFVTRAGSSWADEIRSAATGGGSAARELRGRIAEQAAAFPNLPAEEFADELVQQPVYADIRHGGTTLATGISLLNGLDVKGVVFPYNGGELAPGGFVLVEHVVPGSGEALQAIAVLARPQLTSAEEAALSAVPPDQLEMNVAPGWPNPCDDNGTGRAAFAVGVAVTVTVATATLGCLAPSDADAGAGLSVRQPLDDSIESLGAAGPARELLRQRAEILRQAVEQGS